MIRRVIHFGVGFLVGAAIMYVALLYHVIRANDGWHMIRKVDARLSESYVDIRGFGLSEWRSRPKLALAISTSDQAHLLSGAALNIVDDVRREFWNDR
jgi:hypothetical protein